MIKVPPHNGAVVTIQDMLGGTVIHDACDQCGYSPDQGFDGHARTCPMAPKRCDQCKGSCVAHFIFPSPDNRWQRQTSGDVVPSQI